MLVVTCFSSVRRWPALLRARPTNRLNPENDTGVRNVPLQSRRNHVSLETKGLIYKISYDNLAIVLRQCQSHDQLTTDV